MFGIHPGFLIVLLIIVLIIFGPGKLPEIGGAVGRGIREFRKESDKVVNEVKDAVSHDRDHGAGSGGVTSSEATAADPAPPAPASPGTPAPEPPRADSEPKH